jgi:hypothetical protein
MTPVSVQAFVAEQHAPDATLYLLLDLLADCAADDPLNIEALCQTLGNDAVTPLHRPDLIHTPSACPVLVALATPGVSPSQQLLTLSALRAQEEQGRHKRYVCGWLISSAEVRHLSAHIVSLGQLPLEQGQAFFPIHEPLRMELLAGTFRRNDEGPWWPIRHWLLPSSSGAGSVLTSNCPGHSYDCRTAGRPDGIRFVEQLATRPKLAANVCSRPLERPYCSTASGGGAGL